MFRSNRIRHIVRLKQMLKRWRKKAATPSDVPPGHVAVSVGINGKRFIVRATHLNHPVFKNLLMKAEDEFGFDNYEGPLWIPCDESAFLDALRVVTRSELSGCRVKESISSPLLRSIPEKSIY